MPQFVETVVKHLHIPIPVKRDLPSELISLIELKDITIRLSKDYPRPLITGAIRTELRIPRGMRKLKFVTDGIKAEFYLLHPKDHSRRIALLKTERWDECRNGQTKKIWEIEAMVRDAPVEIIDCEGFDEWIKMMLALKGEEMEAFVEGSCAAGIKTLGTKLKIKRIPVKAKLNIPGIPKPEQLDPKCQNDLHCVETGQSHAKFTVHVVFQNPTPYRLLIEYLHVHLYYDNIRIGEAWIPDTTADPHDRVKTPATIFLQITPESKKAIVDLLTYYVSGKKTQIEIRLHEKSIPSMPHLSRILSGTFALGIILPRLMPDQSHDQILETNWPEDDFVPQDGKVGSPSRGCESPVILSATIQLLSNTLQVKLFNPLDVPIHVSQLSAQAFHNGKHIGDLAAPDDFEWKLNPGVQKSPKIPVSWSVLDFGLDPMKAFSMIFDGVQRGGEVSVDVTAKANVKMDQMELGEIESSIQGIATSLGV